MRRIERNYYFNKLNESCDNDGELSVSDIRALVNAVLGH